MMIDPTTPDTTEEFQPASPDEGPIPLPTPELTPEVTYPDVTYPNYTPQQPIVVRPVRVCPAGYSSGIVQNGQTFADLLLINDVSYQAMRAANPALPTTRLSPGTRYCIPPAGTRRLCPSGSQSYVMGQYEDLNTLSELFAVQPSVFLTLNTQLAPSDFREGRVVCVP